MSQEIEATSLTEKEQSFDLALHTLVSGVDAAGKVFREYTELPSISSSRASLDLKAKVKVGTKLHLELNIPRTLILEKRLILCISGTVVSAKRSSNKQKGSQVSLLLDKAFKIHSAS